MKAIHLNEILISIQTITIPLSKYQLFIFSLILDVQIEKIGLSSIQMIYLSAMVVTWDIMMAQINQYQVEKYIR
ncbi:hypothetical protein Phpb_03669 [Photorhabdus namnaonensis]|uniref:Uncharacterized protein n=1 Tax=Photorhabdus namnaonensis TaxID=1851568 RepID=A0A1B8YDM7_9GAMM|nr:hypothetical protein Phpb_03669 [Photorhabdus namnaonensis]